MQHLQALTKAEIISAINENRVAFNQKNVLAMLHSMKELTSRFKKVDTIKVGDVLFKQELGHPALVLSVRKSGIVIVFLTTTEETEGVILKCSSRFYNDNFVTSTISIMGHNNVYGNIMHCYDNKKEVTLIKRLLSKKYKGIL